MLPAAFSYTNLHRFLKNRGGWGHIFLNKISFIKVSIILLHALRFLNAHAPRDVLPLYTLCMFHIGPND